MVDPEVSVNTEHLDRMKLQTENREEVVDRDIKEYCRIFWHLLPRNA
jgi:hypothetical protein